MRKMKYKRRMALLLAATMVITLFPVHGKEAHAAGTSGPSQSAFATVEQLKTFNTDDTDGSTNSAKVCFGEDNQEWWIAGSQSQDSLVLFAASSLGTDQYDDPYSNSDPNTNIKTYSGDWKCSYEGSDPEDVYVNHYGASSFRTILQWVETNKFSSAEQSLMNDTTIYTDDTKNNKVYSTTDKLYLPYGVYGNTYITVGENLSNDLNNALHVDRKYWTEGYFWLRAPDDTNGKYVLSVNGSLSLLDYFDVPSFCESMPAFELDLSSVIFASAAKGASSGTAKSGRIDDGTAMTLRLDGSDQTIGTVIYDKAAGKIAAQKNAGAARTVSLVVQGNDGTNDWYYSVQAGDTTVVTKEQIQTACSISGDIDLADCKIWLETTIDNVTYARMAEEGTIATPTAPPTEAPTAEPTVKPTAPPTEAPTAEPTGTPTAPPTEAPTAEPTGTPTAPPTEAPTAEPTVTPTAPPTAEPTGTPTAPPTEAPTAEPTGKPTTPPTEAPTAGPTEKPTVPNPDEPVSPEETVKNLEKLDFGASAKWKGNTFMLSWATVRGAEGYDIFAAKCGKKLNKKSLTKIVKEKKTSVSLRKIAGKKISGKKGYKFRIKAWKKIGGKKVYIGKSMIYHVARNKNKKYTNAKKLVPTKRKYALKKGKKVRLKVRIVKQSKKKKLLPHGPTLRYRSNNKKVATVTSSGKVIAKGKGTCYIYAIALNGIRVKIRITVK